MDKLAFPLELKAVAEDGTFEGYASTFGERDLGGDIVEPGAFTKTLKARGPKGVKMLADHDPRERIGVWTDLTEDSKGLYVKGRLLTEKANGREALIDLKAGALDAMSIGFRTKADSYDGRRRARLLKEVDLLEISLVPFPMNEGARVTAVKSMQDMDAEDWRDIEATLRTKGLSRADAVKAVSGFKDWLRRDAGEPDTSPRDEGGAALAEALRRNIALISPKG
ncbi:HK97 family phage prohead protease [Aquabacter sp. L1I39]|uniref:HK97 family phage prohead protease n=1 Tax=Aquabacter sp. L1I39 TaxID=2820278 RepID=UPI001AD98490|nr:HK97 family phage prohead protease [Aquabacter sp. L1I39]QTL01919.1 HK97 family phage prohead protease [Aquabacter sp. L1I39]